MPTNKICIKQWLELLIVPVLVLVVVLLIGNWDAGAVDTVSAEGGLVGYSGMHRTAALYPGEWGYPNYPGDYYPLYPGDGKWDGMYSQWVDFREVQELTVEDGILYAAWQESRTSSEHVEYRLLRRSGLYWYPMLDWANVSLDGPATAIAVDGSKIYVGGNFQNIGGVAVNNIAYRDGTKWNNMGGGISNGFQPVTISDILVHEGSVYVAGDFTSVGNLTANHIARWDGQRWDNLGNGMNNQVHALAVVGGQTYAGGAFNLAGSVAANHVAVWDGQKWQPLEQGTDGTIYSLAVRGNDLYAAGSFSMAGGRVARNIARWDGQDWNPIGPGIGDWDSYPIELKAVAVGAQGIYVGGSHNYSSPLEPYAYNPDIMAHWNGEEWQPLGSGIRSSRSVAYPGDTAYYLNDIAVLDSQVFVGGKFGFAGNNASNSLAVYNTGPVVGVYSPPDTILQPGSRVYLVARFFDYNEQISVQVNSKMYPGVVTSDEDGKVYLHLQTDPAALDGLYEVTLTSGTEVATCFFRLGKSGTLWQTEYGGVSLDLPASVQPQVLPVLLPMISH